MYSTLISPADLLSQLQSPDWRVVDCRHLLQDPQAGARDYRAAHIPGALFANLDQDLAGQVLPGKTGRHPLPEVSALVARLESWGIGNQTQVVVYDQLGGAFAARLWWMLRWLGHSAVAVLDGGWQAWTAAGYPVSVEIPQPVPARFSPVPRARQMVDLLQVQANLQQSEFLLLDGRSADRYRGENETIDPHAGHIPGALSAPYTENLQADKTFRPAHELREHFLRLLGEYSAADVVCYCGSGVTACHNLLALEIAGLSGARLYPGSWSEYCTTL